MKIYLITHPSPQKDRRDKEKYKEFMINKKNTRKWQE